jgi:TP901 family phage tail tape measure protein
MADQQQTAVLTVLLNGEAAKSELTDLQLKAKDLAKQIDEARKAGNHSFAKQLTKDLQETNKAMKSLQRETIDVTKTLNNLSAASPRELSRTLSSLQQKLNNGQVKRGSQEWNTLNDHIRRVRIELKNISAESTVAQSSLSRFSNGFNKYFTMATTFIASITGLSFVYRKLSEDVAKMDDVYSDVMKTTNMTHKEVENLNEDFKKMDTRTSREKLNLLARDAGKLGLTGKKDILDFVEAGNQINVALGEDLGEGAIKNIGKLVNVLEDSSSELQGLDLKGRMLAAGSAINALGQASTANEPYLVAFAGRMGGVAKQAGISMSAILGYASSLDQDMQAVEMSATALQKFIMKIMAEPAKFAKIAGQDVKDFLNLLKTDSNTAILQVLKAMNGKGGFQELIPVFQEMGLDGARAVGVLSSLAGSIDQVQTAQELASKAMIEGTSITNEYNVKNENLMAKLEKAKKDFKDKALVLGEKLNPVLLQTTKLSTILIKTISEVSDWLSKYGDVIIKTMAAIALYTLSIKAHIIEQKIMAFWNDVLVAGSKKLWATIAANPYGAVLVAVTLVYNIYKSLNKEMSIAEQKQKAINDVTVTAKKAIVDQSIELEHLLKIARDETKSKDERLAAIKRLNEISPDYLGNLSLETINTNKATTAVDNYKKSLLQLALVQAAKDKIVELQKQKIDELNKTGIEIYEENAPGWQRFLAGVFGGYEEVFHEAYQKRAKKIASLDAQMEELAKISEKTESPFTNPNNDPNNNGNGIVVNPELSDKAREKNRKELEKIAQEKEKLQSSIDKVYDQFDLKAAERDKVELVRIEQQFNNAEKIMREGLEKKLLSQEQYDEAMTILAQKRQAAEEQALKNQAIKDASLKMKELDSLFAIEESKLAEQHRKEIISDGAYKEKLLELEQKFINKKLAIAGLSQEQINELNKKSSQNFSDTSDFKKNERKSVEDRYSLVDISDIKLREYEIIADYEARGVITHEEAIKAKELIDQEYLETLTSKVKDVEEKITSITSKLTSSITSFQEAETMSVTRKYDEQIKAAGNNSKKVAKLEEKKEKELNAIKAKYADKQFIVTIAQVIATTAVTAMESYKALAGIPVVGPMLGAIASAAAIAAGAGQIAVAKEQRNNAKAGYYSGGYTGGNNPNDVRGYFTDGSPYHGQEFVGNHIAVRNPAIRKVFNIVDEAQKNNTVSSLTEKDFALALDYRAEENRSIVSGISSAIASSGTSGNESIALSSLAGYLNRNAEVTERLNKRLDEPFVGEVSITGRKGIKENLELYDKMIKNASR